MPVRGQGNCAYIVGATHTKSRSLLKCARINGVPVAAQNKATEDKEAARIRAFVAVLLEDEDRWLQIPVCATSLFA